MNQPKVTALRRTQRQDPLWVRLLLIGAAAAALGILVVVPLVSVFYRAFGDGISRYFDNLFADADTMHAILLSLVVAPISVAMNVVFGVAAAWSIAKFRFRGRTILLTIIDLPFSVSPVVAGLLFVLLFGQRGYFGPWLNAHGIHILFNWPALILVTTFTTLPFVARELIPVMEALGPDEELAALSLGANGWQIFWRVTLPNIRWALLYGVILCNARALGEFGAVYVISGKVAGATDTMPLRVEKLMMEYNMPAAFALASLLTMLAGVTLLLKAVVEHKVKEALKDKPAE